MEEESTEYQSQEASSGSLNSFEITVGEMTKTEKDLSFTVTTKTDSPEYKSSNFFSPRTYTDFQWLNEELSSKQGNILPSLPPKPLPKSSEAADLVFTQSLQRYLQRIGSHPVLQKDPSFQKFLEGEAVTFVKKTQTQMFGETSKALLNDMMKRNEQDSFFEDKRAFVGIHENHFKSSLRSLEKLQKTEGVFIAGTKELSTRFNAVGDCTTEESLASGIKKVGKGLTSYAETQAALDERQHEVFKEMFNQGLRDLHASKVALDYRLDTSSEYDKAMKNTKAKRETFEKLKANPQTKPEKLSKAQTDVTEAEKQESDAKDLFFKTTDLLKSEFARMEAIRVQDFKEIASSFVSHQIEQEKNILKIFEDLLADVETISVD